jgi:HEPN domain-containing protein
MTAQDRASDSFRRLIADGRRVVAAGGWSGDNYQRFPAADDYFRFRTEAMNLVRRTCGSDSDHYRELKRLAEAKESATNPYYFVHCLGVLEAAHRDFDAGLLFDLRALIAADVLGDFIEQAEQLLAAGYHIPAASLAGAVLEDTLRKLCEKKGLSVPAHTKIDRLNADLARADAYDKLVQKRITGIADIRNNADHGHFDKFGREDVEDMVKWVKRFSADYLQ